MPRLFLAVDLDDKLKRRLTGVPAELGLSGLRVVSHEQLHLTVRFLGDVDEARVGDVLAAAATAARSHAPFPLELAGGGSFGPPGRPQVVWVGVADATAVRALADDVDAALAPIPCAPRDHPFTAHVTLGRVRGRLGGDLRALTSLGHLGTMTVERVTLFRSTPMAGGSRYQVIGQAPLARDGAQGAS
ncbi:MAG: RNA 2',3'-cyclic phosphodiesterase [Deltaproteobacteria bacterium]|nr:RNA 2',3'-cyclic phosphodiesterase [Deltaproteobacteria bacterium]